MEKVYFETSAFNYLINHINYGSFLNTRELQTNRGRELLVSPITLWEVMLTSDNADFLIFSAQNLFFEKLLATPTELILRYLRQAYPKNIINYDIYTDLDVGRIWTKMTKDNSITLKYDIAKLKDKTSLLRKMSRHLSDIVNYPLSVIKDKYILAVATSLNTLYECLRDDGFLKDKDSSKYDIKLLHKLFSLFTLIIFVLRLDFDSNVVEVFWDKVGIAFGADQALERIEYIFDKYPELLNRGPIIEMTIMAYYQLSLGSKSRGLILDSFHTVYAPYVDVIISADDHFKELKKYESHYIRKLRHISEITLKEVPLDSKKQDITN